MKKIFILFALLFITEIAVAQNPQVEFMPSQITFLPFRANFEEARIGVLYYSENGNLKLDLGGTTEILGFNFPNKNITVTLGIEFMAYALSTSYSGRRLQIDAVDGFFGGHASFAKFVENGKYLARFRIIHNSAHLVDGHYDEELKRWMNDDKPIPFTRDFGELTFAREQNAGNFLLKYYGGVAYATLVRPSTLKKYSFSAGFEAHSNKFYNDLFGENLNLFIAYNFILKGMPVYTGNNHLMIGAKFGEWYGKGLVFYFSYFSGKNVFSEYYANSIKRFGIGFYVDIF